MAVGFEAKLRRWGRSFGIVVPMDKIHKEKFRENESVEILITRRKNPMKETFGAVHLKRPTKKILDESDRKDWDE